MNELLLVGKQVLQRLNDSGYDAYFVGGCVRDYLLDRPIKDIDITTSALPDMVEKLFAKTVATGKKYGTITVFKSGMKFEVTTFRDDIEYNEKRHPIVRFSKSLKEDLKRRDFTINAIAMDKNLKIYDHYNGLEDLKNGVIRCVGKPEDRFTEDPLRMIRMARFAGRLLNFTVDNEIEEFIKGNTLALLNRLSIERIRNELDEILTYDYRNKKRSIEYLSIIMKGYNYFFDSVLLLNDIKYKASFFEHLLYVYNEVNITDNFFKLPNDLYNGIVHGKELVNKKLDKFDLFSYDKSYIKLVHRLQVEVYNYQEVDLDDEYRRLRIKSLRDLDITSEIIIDIIGKERVKEISGIQKQLVRAILENKIKNSRKELIYFVKKISVRHNL